MSDEIQTGQSTDALTAAEPSDASGTCKNCGAPIVGPFCRSCGQAADTRIPSLWDILSEFVDGFFNFDSRIWRTLKPLVFRPGELTREFLGGRRARYVAPFRLYLVLSILFFIVSPNLQDSDPSSIVLGGPPAAPAGAEPETSRCVVELGFLPPDNAIYARLLRSCELISADRGRSLFQDFMARVPLMVFLLVPLTALILKALYALSRRKYVEHLYFLFHVHALFFLVATVSVVLMFAGAQLPMLSGIAWYARALLWIYLAVYGFKALRKVYGQSAGVTLLKYFTFGVSYSVMFALVFTFGLFYTALTL